PRYGGAPPAASPARRTRPVALLRTVEGRRDDGRRTMQSRWAAAILGDREDPRARLLRRAEPRLTLRSAAFLAEHTVARRGPA
ncbi:hypothetical protein, partial [Clavibacter michiganensis]|uniref:hypothetical protein n=1 Tax=Clavibacter michiganensis TaxID=28447 RepID=UPI0029308814